MELSERYRIIKELGDQRIRKFGRVFLVENRKSGKKFVLKHTSFSGLDQHIIDRICNEHHFSFDLPGLPHIEESNQTSEESILILDYQEGETLDKFWSKVPACERLTVLKIILRSLCPLFEFLRVQQIVHCDIKPSNILVHGTAETITVSLIDFGLAYDRTHNDYSTRKILFPLGYAAPELVLNRLECVDHTTDLFALGVVIWRLFAGKLPLTHPNPSIFTNLQITHPLPEHESISGKLHQVLLKMSHKHSFSTAPNLMSPEDVRIALLEAKKQRYQTLPEVLEVLNALKKERSWISRVLFGSLDQN